MVSPSDQRLASSYRYCQRVARVRAGNFYYAFMVLPKQQRRSICAVYAFMRYCDDLSDEAVAEPAALLERWRAALEHPENEESPILPAFADTLERFSIPRLYFHQLIDGAEMDLAGCEYRTFDELYSYCYRVASTVGLVTIHILGFSDPRAEQLAEWCGVAFQLTNILRDIPEDLAWGRVYLPTEELERWEIGPERLREGVLDRAFREMMAFQCSRAADYYQRSLPLVEMVDPSGRACLGALIGIYRRLLERIQQRGYDVFSRRVSLPAWEKLWIAGRCWVKGGLP